MTGFHEVLQTAPQIAHQAKELFDLEMRSNLLQKLVEAGHPYGLLLSQSNASSANGSSEGLINFLFSPEKGARKANLKYGPGVGKTLSSFVFCPPLAGSAVGSLGFQEEFLPFWGTALTSSFLVNSSRAVYESDIGGVFERSSDKNAKSEDFSYGLGITLLIKSLIGSSAESNLGFAHKLNMEQVFHHRAFLAPAWLKLFAGENSSQERTRELVVSQNGVGLGTAAVKLATFRGQEPYVIKTPEGEGVVQINPGDPIGHIHLSHQASQLRQLSPMEKVSIMTEDLLGLFSAIDQPIEEELKPQQQEVLARAKEATVIGISHLVRLFSRKTGLPTWKLDVLPELVQKFHQHDSQAVSKAFGGSRKVRVEDVEMMVLTPEMRRVLVAAQGLGGKAC